MIALVAFGAVAVLTTRALAQSIERNLPPASIPSAPTVAPAAALPADKDATPIGPALAAIVTLGAADPAQTASSRVSTSAERRGRTAVSYSASSRRSLSRKLIAEVEAEIVGRYRALGHPFVSVSAAALEISGGVLQVRVIKFHLGAGSVPSYSLKA